MIEHHNLFTTFHPNNNFPAVPELQLVQDGSRITERRWSEIQAADC